MGLSYFIYNKHIDAFRKAWKKYFGFPQPTAQKLLRSMAALLKYARFWSTVKLLTNHNYLVFKYVMLTINETK